MDAQGIDGCFMFPTLGVGMEEALGDDPEAAVAAFHAFNRWLEDDWGYAYRERIFGAPMIPLVDVDAAVAELDVVLAKGARIVCIKSGPAITRDGRVSPGDARFDPFWARVDEAGVTVGIHSGDAGYNRYIDDWEQVGTFRAFAYSPLRIVLSSSRPPYDTMAALVCQGVFDRFPNVRVASIEAGADWVPDLLKKLAKVYGQSPMGFASDPVATFRRPRVGRPLLRGRHGPAEGPHRPRPHPLRLGLAPRRGTGRAADVRRRPPPVRLHRGRDPDRHARQRSPADRAARCSVSGGAVPGLGSE